MPNHFVDEVNALLDGRAKLLPGPSDGFAWPYIDSDEGKRDLLFETPITFALRVPSGEVTAEAIVKLIRERVDASERVLQQG